ncbi:MAG: cytochrome c oxidase accessory protein CcoG [Deltaproteobacteria bacterium]|nr:cytochrome c oxidase accessory protein CcoG [Deltaproteobacteria bacterium]
MVTMGDFRDTLYTIDKTGRRKWVYPHYAPGRYFRTRTVVAYLLLAIYLSLPWITISGTQGILLDIPHRRFIFFGAEFWATDTIFLFLVLAGLGMSLFFFTSVFGRIWCGWACPETVFLEFLFRPIERLIEGSDSARRKLDRAPWTFEKIRKKFLKHGFCAAASWVIASTALAYFIGREPLLEMMSDYPWRNPGPFFMTLVLMGVMAFQFGWFREQFCTILCPYARFQSVLMDEQSLLVGYDKERGEPRGKVRARETTPTGDCVDCGLCVRVCPTGIDIRNGTQLECIACTACIDACDSIMDGLGRPRGLIRYDSESGLAGEKRSTLRPRVFVYGAILGVLAAVFIYKINHRSPIEIEIMRASTSRFVVETESGHVINQFSLRLANRSSSARHFEAKIKGESAAEIVTPLKHLELHPGENLKVPLFIKAPQSLFIEGKAEVEAEILDSTGFAFSRSLSLFGPEN